MADDLVTIQVSSEARDLLKKIATSERRSMAGQFEWMMTQEYARRFSSPNPAVTIEQATTAAEAH